MWDAVFNLYLNRTLIGWFENINPHVSTEYWGYLLYQIMSVMNYILMV